MSDGLFNFEILVGLGSIILGVSAIIFTFFARARLSNPALLKYLNYTLAAIASFTLFSLSHTAREFFSLKSVFGPIAELPEYIFVSIAYVLIFAGAWSMFKLSEVYGFKTDALKLSKKFKKSK